MATMFDVPQQELVEGVKEELKNSKEIQPPSWAVFVKTGSSRERVPSQDDWWHMRAASVLRLIALRGPIGVSKLRVKYGGKKNRGVRPERFRIASGNILRKILQQLEKAGLAKQAEAGVHKGRVITPAGQKILDKAATQIAKLKPKPEVKAKPEVKKVEEGKKEKPAAEEKNE
ncbi:MAG: 30S ribosomal protein S19e [Nanoarchaeota archaeon]|nr:30S ribosomal protein S19e [Nanoarchaeota archaeon]